MDVKTLVETLHDLFVRFDIASNVRKKLRCYIHEILNVCAFFFFFNIPIKDHNVLRIKFLGDCYYAVAGVSAPNEYHAKCCVNLGLRMIKDIRDIRYKLKSCANSFMNSNRIYYKYVFSYFLLA